MECPQDRRTPSWRSRSFTNLPPAERPGQGVRAGPQEGGDAHRLPRTLTDTCAGGRVRRAPYRAVAPARLELGAAQRGSGGGSTAGSPNPTAQAREHWAPGTQHSPGSGLHPGQAEARRAQDSKDAPAPSRADKRSRPGASRPLQTESFLVTVGAESRAPERATTVVVPPRASQGKKPH